MHRPQSAKPGHRGYWGHSSVEDINDPHQQKVPTKKHVRVIKPDLTANDFARILPRKIHQDKERLYSQALQLKQNFNETAEENVRLKTRITMLQREKEKMNRFIETAPDGLGAKGSRFNNYQNRSYEKDSAVIRNLKKIIKQSREENELLRVESQKIKKMMKYTKINELQIERNLIVNQNKRLSKLLEEYSSQFVNQEEIERQNNELKKYLEEELEEKNERQEEQEKYEKIIQSLQQKIQQLGEKAQAKEKKVLRDLNAQKRKFQQLQRRNHDLQREYNDIRENQKFIQQKQKSTNKSNIRVNKSQRVHTTNRINTHQSENNVQTQQKLNEVQRHNDQLSKQLSEIKEKLKKAESEINLFEDKSKVNYHSHLDHSQRSDKFDINTSKVEKSEENYEQSYEEEFEQQEQANAIKPPHKEEQIQKYKQDFEQNDEEQEIYKKQEKPKKTKHHTEKSQPKKQKKGRPKESVYKPNKKMLSQIKQLLTYRMKSQRYPFNDIKSDIESAQTNTFNYTDLCNMLVNEPFFLTVEYTKFFLAFCFEKEKIAPTETIPNAVLVGKLRKVIDDFQLMDENEEKEMIIRIAEMTSTYPKQLQAAFENIKNGEETIARKDLIQMFKKLQLEEKYIELIISELSLCSDDIQHLNFHGFFERFYIEEDSQEYMDNNAIEEQGEESEQSHRHSSRIKKPINLKSIQDADLQVNN